MCEEKFSKGVVIVAPDEAVYLEEIHKITGTVSCMDRTQNWLHYVIYFSRCKLCLSKSSTTFSC